MRVSAKADYAVRAALELAAAGGEGLKGERIAEVQGIPLKFLENILIELRQNGLVSSQPGPRGGYWLARPADEVTLADVIRAVDGPLATVRGELPEELVYEGAAETLREAWIGLRAGIRGVLEQVSLADVVDGRLPSPVAELVSDPEARTARP